MKKIWLLPLLFTSLLQAQFVTPGNGVLWGLDSLVTYSGGVVTFAGGQYTVNHRVTVSAADRVIIAPGQTVLFPADSSGFDVYGIFQVLGDSSRPVLFTTPRQDSLGTWSGIRFNGSSVDSLCIIRFTKIEYAYYGMRCLDASPLLRHSWLFKCRRGVQLSGSSPSILNNKIERSYEYGITMTLGSSPLVAGNEIANNNTQNTSAKNQISVGTQGDNSPRIVLNKIYGSLNTRTGGISISALFAGSSSSSEIAWNQIYNNSFGIALAGGALTCNIHDNVIYNNTINPDPLTSGSGINLNGNSQNMPVISRNKISGNLWGITIQNGTSIQAGPQPNLGNLSNTDTSDDGRNIIMGNVQGTAVYDLFNNCTNDIMAQNNDWGVYDSASIEQHIVHKRDSTARGTVLFMPFSQSLVPVELLSLAAESVSMGTLLRWSTATETGALHFIVEGYAAGSWQQLGIVAASGSSLSRKSYSFLAPAGCSRYRLTEESYAGNRTVLGEVNAPLGSPAGYSLDPVFPNPFNPAATAGFTLPAAGEASLLLYNSAGGQVAVIASGFHAAGAYRYSINGATIIPGGLPSGVYFLRLTAGSYTSSVKLVLVK